MGLGLRGLFLLGCLGVGALGTDESHVLLLRHPAQVRRGEKPDVGPAYARAGKFLRRGGAAAAQVHAQRAQGRELQVVAVEQEILDGLLQAVHGRFQRSAFHVAVLYRVVHDVFFADA